MVELLLPAAYYLLMLAGSVSLGKVILLLAGGGEGWAEDDKATGLASITGIAVVAVALAIELLLLKGATFPAVMALASIATIGSRAFLFKKPLTLSMPHLDELMEHANIEENSLQQSVPATRAVSPAAQRIQESLSWNTGMASNTQANPSENQTAKTTVANTSDEPPASQKIGEIIRMQGKPSEVKAKPKLSEADDGFSEIKW